MAPHEDHDFDSSLAQDLARLRVPNRDPWPTSLEGIVFSGAMGLLTETQRLIHEYSDSTDESSERVAVYTGEIYARYLAGMPDEVRDLLISLLKEHTRMCAALMMCAMAAPRKE